MLSFLVVVFSVFNHVHGDTCVIKTGEDAGCTTACNAHCRDYLREPTGARKPDPASCAAGETVQDCESIKVSKGISNRNECRNKMQWRDILWNAATDDERATGTLTTTRTIPNFGRYWSAPCEIEKSSLGQIRSVSCSDYQGRGPELDRELAAISFADPGPEAPERQRDYLYLVDGKFGKYCDPAPRSPRTAKTNYRDQIFAAFTARAREAAAETRRERARSAEAAAFRGAAGAAGGRERGRARHAAGRVVPPPPVRVPVRPGAAGPPPPPPPRPAHGATSSRDGTAHEEYVDSLWNEVNQMEEDELRYERALDKLRRAQRSFDMATKLRKLHKKKLRQYYH